MKAKTVLVASLGVVIVCVVASVAVLRRAAAPDVARQQTDLAQVKDQRPVAPTPVVETTAPEPAAPEPAIPRPPAWVKPNLPPLVPPPPAPSLNDPAVKEQLGRHTLSFVGADPDADLVWASLIYDKSLSETVREDLMEDLNENGFSGGDGRAPTVDDLPLIESRLALLEEQVPYADEFMLAHLAEAYKDLLNMWIRLGGQ